MANLTVETFLVAGINPTFVAASAGGDTFVNNGTTYLFVKNSGGSPIDVTVDSVAQCNYGFDHNLTVSVAAGTTQKIGPLSPNRFNDITSKVAVSYSAVTSVTVATLSLN